MERETEPMGEARLRGPSPTRKAYVTATFTVWDEDVRAADEKLRLVEKVIQGRDFTRIAESVSAVEA
jgi:type IV secretory pathway VirB4 component